MQFAQRIFRVAGVYGILVLLPMYFLEERIGRDIPPVITHPEYFYGFIGVALAWQILFLLLAQDPARYRLMIWPAMLEKISYALAIVLLFSRNRITSFLLVSAAVDALFALLFCLALYKTRPGGGNSTSGA